MTVKAFKGKDDISRYKQGSSFCSFSKGAFLQNKDPI